MATAMGTVKKTPLSEFSRPRPSGIIAVDLADGDSLIGVALTDGTHDVMLFSSGGKAVRFDENDVRPMGRNAHGVRGMMLGKRQRVISMLVAEDEEQSVLTATENGYGKRTPIVEYTRHGRGTKGMIAIQQTARNGTVVAAALVRPDDEVMLISTGGVLIRTKVKSIREMSRSTQGVTLINLGEGEKLAGLERVVEPRRGRRASRCAFRPRGRTPTCHRTTTATPSSPATAPRSTRSTARSSSGSTRAPRTRRRSARSRPAAAAYRPEREAQVLARLQAENRGPLSNEAVTGVFRQVMSACLALEQTLRDRVPRAGRDVFARRGRQALRCSSSTRSRCATIDEVFRAAESGQTDYAVVPVENSTEGAVGPHARPHVPDAAVDLRRDPAADPAEPAVECQRRWPRCTKVYSHAQSLAQCAQWLARHLPGAARVAVASNAEAARLAAARAAAPRRSPARTPRRSTGSTSLAPHIEDEPNNTTRFWVLGRQPVPPSGPRRDLARDVGAQPAGRRLQPARAVREARREHVAAGVAAGAHRAVGVPVLRRSRRPRRRTPPVAAALAELKQKAPMLKLLGSYPAAVY